DDTNERRFTRELDDPLTETVLAPMRAGGRDPSVHRRAIEEGHEILHDSRIGRHLRERLCVGVAPLAQYEASRAQQATATSSCRGRPSARETSPAIARTL